MSGFPPFWSSFPPFSGTLGGKCVLFPPIFRDPGGKVEKRLSPLMGGKIRTPAQTNDLSVHPIGEGVHFDVGGGQAEGTAQCENLCVS